MKKTLTAALFAVGLAGVASAQQTPPAPPPADQTTQPTPAPAPTPDATATAPAAEPTTAASPAPTSNDLPPPEADKSAKKGHKKPH